MNVIETKSLTKVYTSSFGRNAVQALTNLDLSVEQGIIFGLLGPNGAGKTTLIKILLNITFATSGTAALFDEDVSNYKIKSRIGYLPENHRFPAYLTGGEVLNFYGRLSGLEGEVLNKKIDELLALVNLTRWKKAKVKTYSKGMMQRLGLAQALINDPGIIFLDEPTDGVDPIGRKEIRDLLVHLKEQGKTIFINSHILSEVELITDKVAILSKGRLITQGNVKELTEKKEEYRLRAQGNLEPFALTKLEDSSYSVKVADINELNGVIDKLRSNNILIEEITPFKTSLEDLFISLIKEVEK